MVSSCCYWQEIWKLKRTRLHLAGNNIIQSNKVYKWTKNAPTYKQPALYVFTQNIRWHFMNCSSIRSLIVGLNRAQSLVDLFRFTDVFCEIPWKNVLCIYSIDVELRPMKCLVSWNCFTSFRKGLSNASPDFCKNTISMFSFVEMLLCNIKE